MAGSPADSKSSGGAPNTTTPGTGSENSGTGLGIAGLPRSAGGIGGLSGGGESFGGSRSESRSSSVSTLAEIAESLDAFPIFMQSEEPVLCGQTTYERSPRLFVGVYIRREMTFFDFGVTIDEDAVQPAVTYSEESVNGKILRKALLEISSPVLEVGTHLVRARATAKFPWSQDPNDYSLENQFWQCEFKILAAPDIIMAGFVPNPVTGEYGDTLLVIKAGDDTGLVPSPGDIDITVIPRTGPKGHVAPTLVTPLDSSTLILTLPYPVRGVERIRIPVPPPPGGGPLPFPPDDSEEEGDSPGNPPVGGGPPPEGWPPDADWPSITFDPGVNEGSGPSTQGCGSGNLTPYGLADARDLVTNSRSASGYIYTHEPNSWYESVRLGNTNKVWFVVTTYIMADPVDDWSFNAPDRKASTSQEQFAWDLRGPVTLVTRPQAGEVVEGSEAKGVTSDGIPWSSWQQHLKFPGYKKILAVKRKLYCKHNGDWRLMSGYILYLDDTSEDTTTHRHRVESALTVGEPNTVDSCWRSRDQKLDRAEHSTEPCDWGIGSASNTRRWIFQAEGAATRPGDRESWSTASGGEDPQDGHLWSEGEDSIGRDALGPYLWADIITGQELATGDRLPDGFHWFERGPIRQIRALYKNDDPLHASGDLFLLVRVRQGARVRLVSSNLPFVKAADQTFLTRQRVEDAISKGGIHYESGDGPGRQICQWGNAIFIGYRDVVDPEPNPPVDPVPGPNPPSSAMTTSQPPNPGDPPLPDREERYYIIPLNWAFRCAGDNRTPWDGVDKGYHYYILARSPVHDTPLGMERWRVLRVKVAPRVTVTMPDRARRQYVNLDTPGLEEGGSGNDYYVRRDCATSDKQNQGKFACLQARVQVNLETIPQGFTRPRSPWHKDWDAPDTWNDWVGARVSFLWFDPPAQNQKPPGETTNAYENVEPTNPQLAHEPYCPNPQGCHIGDNTLTTERVSGVDNTQNFKGMIFGWDHTPADPNQRYYRRVCAASPYFDEPGGALPRICSLVTDEDPPRARALLQMARYGGNNYVIIACLFLRGGNPPCIGPHYVGGHDPPVFSQYWQPGEGVNLARLNDLVVWRKVYVDHWAMPNPASAVPIDDDRRRNIYANGPPGTVLQPTDEEYEHDVNPFLPQAPLFADTSDVAGAFDDGFVEIAWTAGSPRTARSFAETLLFSTALASCPDDHSRPPYRYRSEPYTRCETRFHQENSRVLESTGGPVQLVSVNFLQDRTYYSGNNIRTIPYFPSAQAAADGVPRACYLDVAESGWTIPDYVRAGEAHAFYATGRWLYAYRFVHEPHCKEGIENPSECEKPKNQWHCDDASKAALSLERRNRNMRRGVSHELAHAISGLDHDSLGVSVDCPDSANPDAPPHRRTIMTYSNLDHPDGGWFCDAEITKMRQSLNLPPG